jgi:SAM-dependent methyltransferase
MTDYEQQLVEEAQTWLIDDPKKRAEKIQRETIRHHKLVKDLLLDQLNTQNMFVLEVGGGPFPVSDLIPFKERTVLDPLATQYAEYFPCPNHIEGKIEDFPTFGKFDLVISTNSLDHVEDFDKAMNKITDLVVPGGFLAIMCAENNALTNPHPCHDINLTADNIHYYCDSKFETVWQLDYKKDGYRYGWAKYDGRRGQPAFAILLRNCEGY